MIIKIPILHKTNFDETLSLELKVIHGVGFEIDMEHVKHAKTKIQLHFICITSRIMLNYSMQNYARCKKINLKMCWIFFLGGKFVFGTRFIYFF
jgi:hypothetical protein